MAQEYGAAQPLYDAAKGMYDKASKLLGDTSKPAGQKPDAMKSVPKDNPNRKAWEDATKFTGPDKPATKKPPTKRVARKRG